MKKRVSLFIAPALLSAGWVGAFFLANNPPTTQSYWLYPALTIGMGVGLCLRFLNARKTALLLALTATIGLASFYHFFPESRASFTSVRQVLFRGATHANLHQVKVEEHFKAAPFDQPLILDSPLSLELSIFTRFPAGVDDFCFSAPGDLYASLPSLGVVYRVTHPSGESLARPELFLHGLDSPTGLLCTSDRLLVSETSRIKSYPYTGGIENLLVENLPDDGGTLSHRLLQIPEGLLVSIGSRCDACDERHRLRASLQLLTADGHLQRYAGGLRHIGGLAFDIEDLSLWASERSRLYPAPGAADELNRIEVGGNYGWPACEGDVSLASPQRNCEGGKAAEILLRSRANPAGLMTTAGLDYPLVYRSSLLTVLQGDTDYRIVPAVVRLQISAGRLAAPVAFLGGWDGKTTRPSAIHAGPDGAVFIADEINGAIYRAAWQPSD